MNGYSDIGTGILLYFIYVIILVGLLNTGGVNSFLLPIFIVILTYFFYFRRLWESISISSLTILLLIIDLLIDYSELIDIPFRGRQLMINYFGLISYTSSILLIVVFIIYYERTTSNLIAKEKKNERKYYNLFSNMENGFIYNQIIPDEEGRIKNIKPVLVNDAFSRITGKSKEEIQEKMICDIFPDIDKVFIKEMGKICQEGRELNFEKYAKPISKWIYVYSYSVEKDYFVAIVKDITEAKKSELAIESNLMEREVLIKEMNHRVRNNLQIISSLLSIVSEQIEGKEAKAKFINNKERVMAMALIHEKINKTGDYYKIDFKNYFLDLIDRIFRNHKLKDKVNIFVIMKNILLKLDIAIHLGLLINEVICTSLRYMNNTKDFNFSFYMKEYDVDNINKYNIIIHQNWGYEQDYQHRNKTEIELIELLRDQIDAFFSIEKATEGTIYRIDFECFN
jgi:PAS domain S-box-containing protein